MAELTTREQNAVNELMQALIVKKDDALIKGYQALKAGDWAEYDRQFAVIEQTHTLLKAVATYVWSDPSARPEANANLQ